MQNQFCKMNTDLARLIWSNYCCVCVCVSHAGTTLAMVPSA